MAGMTVGLLSPGDMGHSVAAVLRQGGARVVTCLDGRSERTRALAAEANMDDLPTMDDLVREADIFLSVLVPSRAGELAARVAASLRATGADLLYVDCNAIAPRTVRAIGETIVAAGGRFVDAGIVGPPRRPGTRFYASGPDAAGFAALTAYGLDVRVIGAAIGQASGLKMCYAALTKGLTALGTELLVAARLMGLDDALRAEQTESTPDLLQSLARSLPTMPPKAYRWVGEMEEIAATFADLSLTPNMLLGAADMYRLIADTPIGKESPETRDLNRDFDGVVAAIAGEVQTNT